jgi:hypothetical protein
MWIRGTNMLLPAAGRGHGAWNLTLAATAVLASCLLTPRNARAGHTLKPPQQAVLHTWLVRHRGYRQATDADCDCKEDIRQMRSGYGGAWPRVKDYHPYVATGDFRGNGVLDFAVAVIDRSAAKGRFTLLVFDGPFHSADTPPVFVQAGLDLTHQGFSYGPPRPKPFRLVVGPFESDNTCILSPQGTTYRLDCN